MRRQLLSGIGLLVCMTVLLGLVYPLAMTGASQLLFPGQANGSLVKADGVVVGSALLGQAFDGTGYFQPRPSAAGAGYDALASGPSNLGPSSGELLATVQDRVAAYRELNGLGPEDRVPVDAVTASASGLDPQISVANARIQARRVAQVRSIPLEAVLHLVEIHTRHRPLGVLGEDGVDVLALNVDLDRRTTGTGG